MSKVRACMSATIASERLVLTHVERRVRFVALQVVGEAEIVVRGRVVWCGLDAPKQILDGVVVILQSAVNPAQVRQRLGEIRIEVHGFLKRLQRIRQVILCPEHQAHVAVIRRVGRVDLQGFRETLCGFVEVLFLKMGDAQLQVRFAKPGVNLNRSLQLDDGRIEHDLLVRRIRLGHPLRHGQLVAEQVVRARAVGRQDHVTREQRGVVFPDPAPGFGLDAVQHADRAHEDNGVGALQPRQQERERQTESQRWNIEQSLPIRRADRDEQVGEDRKRNKVIEDRERDDGLALETKDCHEEQCHIRERGHDERPTARAHQGDVVVRAVEDQPVRNHQQLQIDPQNLDGRHKAGHDVVRRHQKVVRHANDWRLDVAKHGATQNKKHGRCEKRRQQCLDRCGSRGVRKEMKNKREHSEKRDGGFVRQQGQQVRETQ